MSPDGPDGTGTSDGPDSPGTDSRDGTGTDDGGPEVTRDAYRSAIARFATGVTVITARGRHPHAMTANAVASVSLDPPLLLVCLEQDARVHDAVLEDGRFGVSVLSAEQERVSAWLSTRGRPQVAQLSQVPTVTGEVLGLPLVAGSLVRLECEVQAAHPAGDHTIVVGAVRGLGAAPGEPLLWFASGYRRLAPDA